MTDEPPPRRKRSARTHGALAVCGLFALLALGSGLDRMAQSRPTLAPHVPAPFASQALRSQARTALGAGDAIKSLALGEAALADAPLDPESPALLGMARLAAGNRTGAQAAFRIAGQLGWRVPLTQAYWMDRALEVRDYRVAAMRLDAMLRQQPAMLADRRLMDRLEQVGAGRAALAERLQAGPGWLRAYSTQVANLAPDVLLQRSQVLGELARRGGMVGCEAIAPLVENLVQAEAIAEASALWRQHCPGAASALVHDGTFAAAQLGQVRSQFAWTFMGQGDASVMLEPAAKPPGKQVVIESSAPEPRLIVRQMVLVEPGRYRLRWRAGTAEGKPSDLAIAALTCSPDPKAWLEPQFDEQSQRWSAVVTVDGTCPARWLGFGIVPRPGTVTLGDVEMVRLP